MNWAETINTISCLFLLYSLLVVAAFANNWRHRMAVAPLTAIVALQTIDPIVSLIPSIAWPAVALNAGLVLTIALLRKELMAMVKAL